MKSIKIVFNNRAWSRINFHVDILIIQDWFNLYPQFIDAINLMLDNAFTYNRKNTRIYKHAARLKDVFKANIDAPMKRLGYCCGKNVSSFNKMSLLQVIILPLNIFDMSIHYGIN